MPSIYCSISYTTFEIRYLSMSSCTGSNAIYIICNAIVISLEFIEKGNKFSYMKLFSSLDPNLNLC